MEKDLNFLLISFMCGYWCIAFQFRLILLSALWKMDLGPLNNFPSLPASTLRQQRVLNSGVNGQVPAGHAASPAPGSCRLQYPSGFPTSELQLPLASPLDSLVEEYLNGSPHLPMISFPQHPIVLISSKFHQWAPQQFLCPSVHHSYSMFVPQS